MSTTTYAVRLTPVEYVATRKLLTEKIDSLRLRARSVEQQYLSVLCDIDNKLIDAEK